MARRPLGLWNDSWRVYALGVLLGCFTVSVICIGAFWPLTSVTGVDAVAITIAAGAIFALFAALCAGLAYWVVDADRRPLIRWLGLSLVNCWIPIAIVHLLLGGPALLIWHVAAPLIALHAVSSGLFLIGRRPRPPLPSLPPIPQPVPHGWDSRH